MHKRADKQPRCPAVVFKVAHKVDSSGTTKKRENCIIQYVNECKIVKQIGAQARLINDHAPVSIFAGVN
jgi:hypothetical protein